MDPTGFVTKALGKMPLPNNYEVAGDGLNTAGHRWVRANENGGTEDIFGINAGGIASLATWAASRSTPRSITTSTSNNKVGVSYTYEWSAGKRERYEAWPGGFRGSRLPASADPVGEFHIHAVADARQ